MKRSKFIIILLSGFHEEELKELFSSLGNIFVIRVGVEVSDDMDGQKVV